MSYSIGTIERDTGIARDTLRVWERRYGFPVPERDTRGQRLYDEDQLRKLQRIKRLMGQGHRPGKLLALSDEEIDSLEAQATSLSQGEVSDKITDIMAAVLRSDPGAVDRAFAEAYAELGMKAFILEVVAPLLVSTGERWVAGELQIYQEHMLSERLIRFINTEISRLQDQCRKPLVLLATLPEEQHTLGLLMVSAMLTAHRVSSIDLGGQVPVDQIADAARQMNVDVVGITFSGAYHYPSIRADLNELRDAVDDGVEIWVGGEGVRKMRKLPDGVTRFTTLEELPV